MPYPKNETSRYNNFGGINAKTSVYNTNDNQQLDIRNMDFFIPNALTKRPGSTLAASGLSGPVHSLFEYENTNGFSTVIAAAPSGVFLASGPGVTSLVSGSSVAPFDMLTYSNYLWAANGQNFYRFNGSSLINYSFPNPTKLSLGATGVSTGYLVKGRYFYTYLNDRGTFWQISDDPDVDYVQDYFPGVDVPDVGGAFAIRLSGFTAPENYGISAIYLWRSDASFIIEGQFSGIPETVGDVNDGTFFLRAVLPTNTMTFVDTFPSISFVISASFAIPPTYNGIDNISPSLVPKYIETNLDRMYMSGVTLSPSTVYFSEVGDPENVEIENFIEVNSNDGDRIYGLKAFQNEIIIFKKKSFYKLIGDNPDNFALVLLTKEYGALSNRAVAEYDNVLMFLDEKGIVKYDGANWSIVSHPVEHIFRRMNISAALENACAVHYQFRNQVWFGIPIDNSIVNNITVVYDYLLNAWTLFEGFNASSFAMIKNHLTQPTAWHGNYSGQIHYFSTDCYGDNGSQIQCFIETKFDAPDGQNVENMFRRFFLDVKPELGGESGAVSVEVFKNYEASPAQASFTFYQDQFQSRADFGVPARSIGFRMSHVSASLPLTINGYLVQRRYLREV